MIAQVRRFNRTVTQRVGALDDRFLERGRPLGAARVLWEIGDDGCDVRSLRSRLDLDSGYLSRLLRSLEADGLIEVDPSDSDRRVRTARLTASGRRGTGRARAPQRRAGRVAPRTAQRRTTRPPRGRDGRRRAPADRGDRRDRARRSAASRRPALPERSTSPSSTRASRPASTRS